MNAGKRMLRLYDLHTDLWIELYTDKQPGIKEKILAAKRAGIKEIVLCKHNERDVEEINPDYIKDLKFHYVDEMLDTKLNEHTN